MKPPTDDPIRVTPWSVANDMLRIGNQLSRLEIQVRQLAPYLQGDQTAIRTISAQVRAAAGLSVDTSMSIRLGRLPIIPGLLERSGAEPELPLIAAIEANRKPLFDGLDSTVETAVPPAVTKWHEDQRGPVAGDPIPPAPPGASPARDDSTLERQAAAFEPPRNGFVEMPESETIRSPDWPGFEPNGGWTPDPQPAKKPRKKPTYLWSVCVLDPARNKIPLGELRLETRDPAVACLDAEEAYAGAEYTDSTGQVRTVERNRIGVRADFGRGNKAQMMPVEDPDRSPAAGFIPPVPEPVIEKDFEWVLEPDRRWTREEVEGEPARYIGVGDPVPVGWTKVWSVATKSGKKLGETLAIGFATALKDSQVRYPNQQLAVGEVLKELSPGNYGQLIVPATDETDDSEPDPAEPKAGRPEPNDRGSNRSGQYRERNRNDLPEELRGLMDDQVNDSGIYDRAEEIKIEFPKSYKCSASVRVAQGNDGGWRSAMSVQIYRGNHTGRSKGVSVHDKPYPTREIAIRSAACEIIGFFRTHHEEKAQRVVEAFDERLGPAPIPDPPEPKTVHLPTDAEDRAARKREADRKYRESPKAKEAREKKKAKLALERAIGNRSEGGAEPPPVFRGREPVIAKPTEPARTMGVAPHDPPGEEWRSIEIDQLGLSDVHCAMLRDREIENAGQLAYALRDELWLMGETEIDVMALEAAIDRVRAKPAAEPKRAKAAPAPEPDPLENLFVFWGQGKGGRYANPVCGIRAPSLLAAITYAKKEHPHVATVMVAADTDGTIARRKLPVYDAMPKTASSQTSESMPKTASSQTSESMPPVGSDKRWEVFDARAKPPMPLGEVTGANVTRAALEAEAAWPGVPRRSIELRLKGATPRNLNPKPAEPKPDTDRADLAEFRRSFDAGGEEAAERLERREPDPGPAKRGRKRKEVGA